MSTFTKAMFIVGAILTITGSFLPWQQAGDFVSYWTYGIQVSPSIKDNGGLLIVLLSGIMLMLILRPTGFIEKPAAWAVPLNAALVLISAFQVGRLLIERANASGVIGAPSIEIGLLMVSAGSILLLVASVKDFRKRSVEKLF
jgi:hypothetical protein